jgi:hypothetical protein
MRAMLELVSACVSVCVVCVVLVFLVSSQRKIVSVDGVGVPGFESKKDCEC